MQRCYQNGCFKRLFFFDVDFSFCSFSFYCCSSLTKNKLFTMIFVVLPVFDMFCALLKEPNCADWATASFKACRLGALPLLLLCRATLLGD